VDDKHADLRLTPAPECEGEEEQGREAAFTWGLLVPGGRRAARAGGLHTGALASHARARAVLRPHPATSGVAVASASPWERRRGRGGASGGGGGIRASHGRSGGGRGRDEADSFFFL